MNTVIKTGAFVLIAVIATTQSANAKDWYLGGSIGYNQTSDQTSEGPSRVVDVEYEEGYALSTYVGFRKTENLRFEGEFAFRRNDGEALSFNNVARPFAGAGTESYSLLANAIYDIPTDSAITPYVGVGAGIAFLENDFVYGPATFQDKETAFVYQGMVGASMPVTDRIDLFVDGRYFAATGVDFTRNSPADSGVSLDSEYDNFTISVGYRFKL